MQTNIHSELKFGTDEGMKSSEHKVGPRAKCDQVVYEAIAKAAEIIVRGRCRCENNNDNNNNNTDNNNANKRNSPSGSGSRSRTHSQYGTNSSAGNGNGNNTTTTNTGTRFYLEIEEVTTVRSILQMWKRSLHVPLRLDVYYEYCTDPTQPDQSTRKELLERWCIDYLVSHEQNANSSLYGHGSGYGHGHENSQSQHHHGSNVSPRHKSDDMITQLRQVVKRVMVQLRVLFSLTRMMPAYRLHHALMDDLEHGNRNHALSNLNRPLGSGPGLGGGYYQNNASSMENIHQNQDTNTNTSYRDLVGGQINFSFYVSDTPPSENRLNSDALFSSSTNKPFARHDLDPIPTPFGVLHLTSLFDESLSVENVLTNRAKRIMEWGKIRSKPMSVPFNANVTGNGYGQHGYGHGHANINVNTGQHSSQLNGNDQHQRDAHLQSSSVQSRAIPIKNDEFVPNNNSPAAAKSIDAHHHHLQQQGQNHHQHQHQNFHQHHHPQYHQNQHQHQHRSHSNDSRGRPHYLKQMSMPDHNPMSVSPHVVSEHFRRNHASNIDRPKSADPNQIRERLGSDPGRSLLSKGIEKRALSGLSLALMNDDPNVKSSPTSTGDTKEQQQQQQKSDGASKVLAATPPSPLIPPAFSGDEFSSLRQRMAFHHPPPSFDDDSLPNGVSASLNQNTPTMTAQHTSLYGYGYNNGHHVIPPQSTGVNIGSSAPSRTNSPSPMPINTPPQPMFIGSHPRGSSVVGGSNKLSPIDQTNAGINGIVKSKISRDDDIPFRNPTSLQAAPVQDTGISMAGLSSHLASVQASFQTKSIVNSKQAVTKDTLLPPLTTHDALASSPFKLSQSVGGPSLNGPTLGSSPGSVSIFSSLVMGKGSAAYGPLDEGFPLALASGSGSSSAFLPSRSNSDYISRSGIGFPIEKEDHYDDMPFAVDLDCSNQCSVGGAAAASGTTKSFKQGSTADFGISSSNTMSSQVVTSLAHRCATAGRLKLFSNAGRQEITIDNSASLDRSVVEDQLNEFRSFSDSITASGLLTEIKR